MPASTYRLQLNAQFRFTDVLNLLPYLHSLGITHCYFSPILKARPGSMHGYDITDHNQLNLEIGTEEDLEACLQKMRSLGMGLILDTVPNHMGVGYGTTPWWQDVLENGQASEYSNFFDIDWEPLKPEMRGKVLLPILGETYGEALEEGKLKLDYQDGRFRILYYDKQLPVDPQTYPLIFDEVGDLREFSSDPEWRARGALESMEVTEKFRALPHHATSEPVEARRRRLQIPILQAQLVDLQRRYEATSSIIAASVHLLNGVSGVPRSFGALHRLLEAQAYRVAFWRVSSEEINYRRFFDINDLVGLRMENPAVFAATHRLVRKLLAKDVVTGLRLDHPDGLLNPTQYFARLQMLFAASRCEGPEASGPLAENGIEKDVVQQVSERGFLVERPPLYLLIEKILEPGEKLPQEWPVDGTVGYEFGNLLNDVFIQRENERALTNLYYRFIDGALNPDTMVYESKKLIMDTSLSSELTVLTDLLQRICNGDRRARDFTRNAIMNAIREVIACFPVYRTYIDERGQISERDRMYIQEATARAKRRNRHHPMAIYDFLRSVLLLESGEWFIPADQYRERLHFTLKFQQLTGPVMAKGLEDTTCYVYNRFISANEVGGSPARFGTSLEAFHEANCERAREWPHSMLTTSTHDSKRSEDVRARLNVLSEIPSQWSSQVSRWRRINRTKKKTLGDGKSAPDANEEYFLYQTLVGAWPLEMTTSADHEDFVRRVKEYMTKALNEAKVNTSWTNPNAEYQQAVENFVERILTPSARQHSFLAYLQKLLSPVAFFGALNSLAQVVLKLTCPGVPDMYRGTELWDFSLVDPDNRRPVDYDLRQRLLRELQQREQGGDVASFCGELLREWKDGRAKMWTAMRILNFRREHAALFQQGSYEALSGDVLATQHVIAFTRRHESKTLVVAVPRFAYSLMKGETNPPLGSAWRESALRMENAPASFRNILTGETVSCSNSRLLCSEVFASFPVAVLSA